MDGRAGRTTERSSGKLDRVAGALRRARPRSVYDVMAAISCFGVLTGGVAYAAATITGADIVDESLTGADIKNLSVSWYDLNSNSVTSSKVVDNALTGADVDEATLAKVPSAVNADKLGGVAAKPAVQRVAAGSTTKDNCAGSPPVTGVFCSEDADTFWRTWTNWGPPFEVAGYYKDALGIVHLEGLIHEDGSMSRGSPLFYLPVGMRPAAAHIFAVTGREESEPETTGRVDVMPDGLVQMTVRPDGDPSLYSEIDHLSLDGISFRAG